jgi:hypothetical protein
MNSWKTYLSEYDFVEWNEESFDVNSHPYTKTAYAAGKYAFVSDYVRAYALHKHGGVYLDTDVEIKASLNEFLSHEAFSGFEEPNSPFTAVWGSEMGHRWPYLVLRSYENSHFNPGYFTPNTQVVSDLLTVEFGINRTKDEFQQGNHGVAIYPSSTFCLDLPRNVATHHFGGSWLKVEWRAHWKYQINRNWRVRDLADFLRNDDSGEGVKDLILLLGVRKVSKALFPIFLLKVIKALFPIFLRKAMWQTFLRIKKKLPFL